MTQSWADLMDEEGFDFGLPLPSPPAKPNPFDILSKEFGEWIQNNIPHAKSIGLFLILFVKQMQGEVKSEHDFDAIRAYYSCIKILTKNDIKFIQWSPWAQKIATRFENRLADHVYKTAMNTRMDNQLMDLRRAEIMFNNAKIKHIFLYKTIRDDTII